MDYDAHQHMQDQVKEAHQLQMTNANLDTLWQRKLEREARAQRTTNRVVGIVAVGVLSLVAYMSAPYVWACVQWYM